LRAKYKFVDKMKEPSSFAAERGTEVHKMGENYLLGKITGVPAGFNNFKDELKGLKALGATPEGMVSFDSKWRVLPKDAPYEKKWLISVLDATVRDKKTSTIVDYKTGKIYPDDHKEQGELYALGELMQGAEKVDVEMWYLDQNHIEPYQYLKKEKAKLLKKWKTRGDEMISATEFPATPSKEACQWCHFAKKKEGPCPV
jgi:hypothetical protein